jgi:hypothetical protein
LSILTGESLGNAVMIRLDLFVTIAGDFERTCPLVIARDVSVNRQWPLTSTRDTVVIVLSTTEQRASLRRGIVRIAMPFRLCPTCQIEARLLDHVSKAAPSVFYRCDRCGVVWAFDKVDPSRPAERVTPQPSADVGELIRPVHED